MLALAVMASIIMVSCGEEKPISEDAVTVKETPLINVESAALTYKADTTTRILDTFLTIKTSNG